MPSGWSGDCVCMLRMIASLSTSLGHLRQVFAHLDAGRPWSGSAGTGRRWAGPASCRRCRSGWRRRSSTGGCSVCRVWRPRRRSSANGTGRPSWRTARPPAGHQRPLEEGAAARRVRGVGRQVHGHPPLVQSAASLSEGCRRRRTSSRLMIEPKLRGIQQHPDRLLDQRHRRFRVGRQVGDETLPLLRPRRPAQHRQEQPIDALPPTGRSRSGSCRRGCPSSGGSGDELARCC